MDYLRIIEDGAVLISEGKIVETGMSRRFGNLAAAKGAEEIAAYGKVVMPGFIDCSVSLLSGPPAYETASNRLPVRGWPPRRMELETRRRLRWFARGGTTYAGAGCGHGRDEATELKALKVLRGLDERLIGIEPVLHAFERGPEFESDREYAEWLAGTLIPAVRERRLARSIECAPWPGVEQAAAASGLRVRIRSSGRVRAGPVDVLLPDAEARPDEDGALALSTGFDACSSPFTNMQAALWNARVRLGFSPEECLTASTINAAHVLGIEKRTGSLESGKDADIVMLQTGDYRDLSWYVGSSLVAMVFAKGLEVFPRLEAL